MENLKQLMKKNKIIICSYKGGGYDGCIWEWNYSIYSENKWHHAFSSGSLGAKTDTDLYYRIKDKDLDIYLPQNKESFFRFCREKNPGHVLLVSKWLKSHTDLSPKIVCEVCEEEVDPDYMLSDRPSSDGGIRITNKRLICHECYSLHTCVCCGEYSQNLDSMGYCEYCSEK